MKQILLALSILGFTFVSAEAQTTTTTTSKAVVKKTYAKKPASDTPNYAKNYKVCKGKSTYYTCGKEPSVTKKTKVVNEPKMAVAADAKSANAKNYKVCQGNGNYHICSEQPNQMNSVKGPGAPAVTTTAANKPVMKKTVVTEDGVVATSTNQTFATQPTAAPALPATNDGNELPQATIVDTITNATAPYHGQSSPQYDGLQRNKQRNLNTPPQSPNSVPLTR